jgi:hypothetical protein
MRLTALGKLVILILAIGVAVGGYRTWQQSTSGGAGGFKLPNIKTPQIQYPGGNNGGSNNSGNNNSGNNGGNASAEVPVTQPAEDNEIRFVITAAKTDWVKDQITRFNEQSGGKYKITPVPLPSREAMHDILNNKVQPVLWSPGSPIWPARLSEAWSQKNGNELLDMNDPNGYRVFLRSPLVFLTTKDKARFLRPRLGGPNGWQELRKLSLRPQSTPWGSFRFSHADPLKSSSGMLTLGLIMSDYAARNGLGGQLTSLASNNKFWQYVTELERSLVYDKPAESTTKLTQAFLEDPTRYDVITAYESAALEAASTHPNIAVIYPSPTAVSEHAVSLFSAPWITPTQKEGALALLQFMGTRESLQAGLKYHFRPAAAGSVSLRGELEQHAGQGFQQSYSSIELPPYEALNSVAYQWSKRVARKQ